MFFSLVGTKFSLIGHARWSTHDSQPFAVKRFALGINKSDENYEDFAVPPSRNLLRGLDFALTR
jgi:hypothetical protein